MRAGNHSQLLHHQFFHALLHDLHLRLVDDCVPAFTTDGLRSYFYAITAHFGSWWRPPRARTDHWQPALALLHGQLIKRKRGRQLTFTVTRMTLGKRRHLMMLLKAHGFNLTIQTAFVERVNLTIRQCISLLTRRTCSTTRSDTYLLAHVEWWRAYYHFERSHQALRVPLPGYRHKFRSRTPAMALGLTDHVWSVADILHRPLITTPALSSVPT
jgi:IS1 family transposase